MPTGRSSARHRSQKTFPSRQAFLDAVITPFNARLATPLEPTVRGIYADGDMVIAFFDAAATTRDDQLYRNTYTSYFRMRDAKVISAVAFFDTWEFDDFWNRVAAGTMAAARTEKVSILTQGSACRGFASFCNRYGHAGWHCRKRSHAAASGRILCDRRDTLQISAVCGDIPL